MTITGTDSLFCPTCRNSVISDHLQLENMEKIYKTTGKQAETTMVRLARTHGRLTRYNKVVPKLGIKAVSHAASG